MKIQCAAFLALFSGVAYGAADLVPPHLALPGSGVKVHYVHLHGDSAVKMFGDRKQLFARIQECQKAYANSGVKIQMLSEDDIPEEPNPFDKWIYSSSDRSVTVTHAVAYGYSMADCGLIKAEGVTTVIKTPGGRCDINPKTKTAVGDCDLKSAASLSQPFAASMQKPQGSKQVAGHSCAVYGSVSPVKSLVCVSKNGSFEAFPSTINPVFATGMPLWFDTTFGKAEAVDAKFDMSVNPGLFQIPDGFKIISRLSVKGNQ